MCSGKATCVMEAHPCNQDFLCKTHSQWRGFDFEKYGYQYHIVTKVDYYNYQRNDNT
jgi:hypothetical protein